MTIRKVFELTAEQHAKLLDAMRPVPYMLCGGGRELFSSQQENANAAWRVLGAELGFVWDSVLPVPGKSSKFFSATTEERE